MHLSLWPLLAKLLDLGDQAGCCLRKLCYTVSQKSVTVPLQAWSSNTLLSVHFPVCKIKRLGSWSSGFLSVLTLYYSM